MHVHAPSLLSFPQHSWKHKKKRSQQVRSMETFHDHGGTPKWMISFMENPKIKWMMVPGVPPWLRKPPYILYIYITCLPMGMILAGGMDILFINVHHESTKRWFQTIMDLKAMVDVADVANWLLSSPMDRSSRNMEWVVYLSRVEKLLENQSFYAVAVAAIFGCRATAARRSPCLVPSHPMSTLMSPFWWRGFFRVYIYILYYI